VPGLCSFDYAILRVVPQVAREEFLNVGALVFCLRKDFLGCQLALDETRLLAFAPDLDLSQLREHLAAIPRICAGGPDAGPIGQLPLKERWHWLVAPRSTLIQLSAVHSGLCDDPAAALDRILTEMVKLPPRS